METQLTDFENAAFTVFIVLVTRVVLAFDLCLYIPLSKVDENMKRAQKRDAVSTQRFFFRKALAPLECEDCEPKNTDIITSVDQDVGSTDNTATSTDDGDMINRDDPADTGSGGLKKALSFSIDNNGASNSSPSELSDEYEEMNLDEIFNGTGKLDYYPGLIPLVYAYLDYVNCDPATFRKIDKYLGFISKRSKGELMTPASWIRKFVQNHPDYKQDSIISESIAHDLMVQCKGIGEGTIHCPELLGDVVIDKVRPQDAYGHILPGRLSQGQRSELVENLLRRGYVPREPGQARGAARRFSGTQDKVVDEGRLSDTNAKGGSTIAPEFYI